MTPSESPPPLDSLFPELRDLPRQPPRREMLPGLQWRALFRGPMLMLLPFLLIFTAFPIAIFASMSGTQTPRDKATARVIQVETVEPKQVFVKYVYAADGRNYTGASVGGEGSLLSTLRVGSALPIRFEINQPQNSAPVSNGGNPEDFLLPLLFFFPVMAVFFFAPLFFPQLRAVWMARKLFASGVLSGGKIRFVRSLPMQSPMQPGGNAQIFYEFTDQNGTLRRGTMKCDNAWLVQQFHVESPVVVAFNPKKPAQNAMLEPFVA